MSLELALAIVRGEIAPDAALVKAAGAKPPAGYQPVANGQHGGYRKKTATGWTYWYPDTDSAKQSEAHHSAEHRRAHNLYSQAHDRAFGVGMGMRPYNPKGQEVHTFPNTAAASSAVASAQKELREHEEHVAGARAFQSRRAATEDRAAAKKRDAEYAQKVSGVTAEAAEGKHRITDSSAETGFREVDTVARHGLYAVHGDKATGFAVTHAPSGLQAARAKTAAEAGKIARHFHEHAGDAGHDGAFGSPPAKEAMARIAAAHRAQKSMADWHPMQHGAPDPLAKSMTDNAGGDRQGVRPDAFARLGEPPSTSKPDIMLKGIGAGFDPRWNDTLGFGRSGQ